MDPRDGLAEGSRRIARRSRPVARPIVAVLVIACCGLLAACNPFDASHHTSPARPAVDDGRPRGPVSTGSPLRVRRASSLQVPADGVFGAGSIWRSNLAGAPRAANSARMVAGLVRQVTSRYGGVAAFNVGHYNASFYRVPAKQQPVTVLWDDCQGRESLPAGLYGSGGQFLNVPLPSNAVPAAGSDASLVIYQPGTDTMWDLWRVARRPDGWHACWGGRMDHVSRSGGWFAHGFGSSATGLSVIGGAIGIREARAGRIRHALALAIPEPAQSTDVSWPAQRSDGSATGPDAIPEGTRFRLDPRLKVGRLHLNPIAAMIARAAQRYGFVVTDRSGAVAVVTESGTATQAVTGTDPWHALLRGTPDYLIMKNFPWQHLQALPKNYGRPRK